MSAQKRKASHINLLPQSDFEATPAGRILKWALTSFRMIVIGVELVVIVGFLSRFALDMMNSDLNDEIEAKEALIQSRGPFEQEFRLIQRKIATYAFMTDDSAKTAPLIARLASKVPPDTQLISITKSNGRTILRASSLSERSILQFITNARKEPELAEIQLTDVESRAESAFITFTLATPEIPETVEGAEDGSS